MGEPEITYAHKADPKGQRFQQFASMPLPDWAADVRPVTNETTKPVVTQADREAAAGALDALLCACEPEMVSPDEGLDLIAQAFARHRLASQAVVSQDLVPVAWMQPDWDKPENYTPYCPVTTYPRNDWRPLYPPSAIEAAQIAARNQALEEAAKIADEITDLAAKAKNIGLQAGAMSAAHRIRSLRTPSQHQEEQ